MSVNILRCIYVTIRIDAKNIEGCYIVQRRSEPYSLQEDSDMKDYEPLIKAWAGEILCDANFKVQYLMQHIGIHQWIKEVDI